MDSYSGGRWFLLLYNCTIDNDILLFIYFCINIIYYVSIIYIYGKYPMYRYRYPLKNYIQTIYFHYKKYDVYTYWVDTSKLYLKILKNLPVWNKPESWTKAFTKISFNSNITCNDKIPETQKIISENPYRKIPFFQLNFPFHRKKNLGKNINESNIFSLHCLNILLLKYRK